MAKKPKSIQQLGDEIIAELERTHQLPDNLESIGSNSCSDGQQQIYDIEFDIVGTIRYGSCEGFYTDIYMEGYYGENGQERKRALMLSAKTLSTNRESIEKMSLLAAACVFVGGEYIDHHKEELTRRGYRCKETPDSAWGLIVSKKKDALKYKAMGYEVYDYFNQKLL